MLIQKAVHGKEAIIGEEFPQERRKEQLERLALQQEGEPRHMWEIRKYLTGKQQEDLEARTPSHEKDFRDMNPDGFWECEFSVAGISPYRFSRQGRPMYAPDLQTLLDEVEEGKDLRIMKVVSQGLLNSNPRYIGKLLYSIRHPRAVAKSQERLIRGFNYLDKETGEVKNAFEDVVVHTPEMFIQVTTQAAAFLLRYPEIPVHFLHFEDLVENPSAELDKIAEFVGTGDYRKARGVVKQSLNRSHHEDVESELWPDAEVVYERFCRAAEILNQYKGSRPSRLRKQREKARGELEALLDYMRDGRRPTNKQKANWRCFRAKRTATAALCRECVKGGRVMRSLKRHSEATPSQFGVTKHWSQEPCLFECGLDVEREPSEYITPKESIENNSWNTPDDSASAAQEEVSQND
jgi:hypothetical protein